MPLKISEPVEIYSEPTYCTKEMSLSTDNVDRLLGYSGCTVGEEIMLPQPLNQGYQLNYLHLAIRGMGLLLMLIVTIIWFIKLLFWVTHKIAKTIGRDKVKNNANNH